MIRAIRSVRLWQIFRYTLIFLSLIMTETVLLPRVFSDPVVPDLVLCAVIAVGMAENEKTAGVCGLCAGFFLDAAGTVGVSLSPLYYMLCGYVTGVFARTLLNRNFPSYLVYMLVACVTRAGQTLLLLQFGQADCPLHLAFAEILAPEFLYTMLASPLLYLIVALPLAKENRRELKN
ncbi:MAG: rod shape-determining protein MreD [Clostridia bacterium]|nr:rod shape-determining protein MreD [Clostridia bacterium]